MERAISRRSNLSLSLSKLVVSTSLSATLLNLYQHIEDSKQLKNTRAQPYFLITNLILPMYILWRELQMQKKTVEAYQSFEQIAKSHGVTIHHYHANNGLFDTFTFKAKVATSNQTMSLCGVNAHHQNVKAENRVKDVTIGTRTSLLHAAHRWLNMIHSSLWPAAIKYFINIRNSLPTKFCQIQFITILHIFPVGSRKKI